MKKSTKKIMILYSLIIVATLLGETTLANAIAATFTISSGVLPGAPSYTIWKEGSTYYAKNAYGAMLSGHESGSSNASHVFQDSVDALGVLGGRILAKAGDYSIPNTIMVTTDNVWIEGEILGNINAGTYGTHLTASNNVTIFNATSSTYSGKSDFSLKNLYIQGYEGLAIDVYVKFYYWAHIENCKFRVGWSYALYLDQCEMPYVLDNEFHEIGETAIALSACAGGYVERNNIYYCGTLGSQYSAISLSGDGANAGNDISICNNYISDMYGHGITLYMNKRTRIIGNVIKDVSRLTNNASSCFVLQSSNNSIIEGNVVRQTAEFANHARYGFAGDAASIDNIIVGNQFVEIASFIVDWATYDADNIVEHNEHA